MHYLKHRVHDWQGEFSELQADSVLDQRQTCCGIIHTVATVAAEGF